MDFLPARYSSDSFLVQNLPTVLRSVWQLTLYIGADVSANIGGGLGLEPTTIRAVHREHGAVNYSATPVRFYTLCGVCLFVCLTKINVCKNRTFYLLK